MRVNAEQFNEEIRVESRNISVDANGDRTISWQLFGTYFAAVDAKAARRRVGGNQEEFFTAYRLTLRAPAAITNDMRVIWNGLTLAIEAIAAEKPNLILTCREEAQ